MTIMYKRFLALLLVVALGGCATLGEPEEPPRVSLAGLDSLAVQGFEQRYRVRLRVQNPNRQPLVVQGISFRLYLNDQMFGDGVGPANVTIDPFSDAVTAVDVTSNLYLLFRQFQGLSEREGTAVHWRIDGNLALAGRRARVPFESEGQLALGPTGQR